MKKLKYIWLGLALFIAVPLVQASELKIGVVNAAKVMNESPQKAAALARLEKEFSARSKKLQNERKALVDAQNKLDKDAAILSADDRKQRERDLLSKQRDLKRKQDEYSEDLSIRRNEELQKLEKEIATTIVELAKKDSYDMVLYQGVIYASDKVDLTDKVIALLKAKAKTK